MRTLTQEQLKMVNEFVTAYGLDESQILFDGDNAQPMFDADAQALLAHRLCPDIKAVRSFPPLINAEAGMVSVEVEITLHNGQTHQRFGACFTGEVLGQNNVVESVPQAVNLAHARAYRQTLRSIGFEALRAHREAARNLAPTLQPGEQTERQRLTKGIHAVAEDLGYIKGKDRQLYEDLMGMWFGGKRSSVLLDERELNQFFVTLKSLQAARERALAS